MRDVSKRSKGYGRRNTIAIVAFVIAFFWAASSAESAGTSSTRIAAMQARAKPIICKVFGRYCREALSVAWCESRHYKWAVNGQYRGLFQVSEYWREAVPGWGPGAWAQSRHAYRVFRKTGSHWGHWSCKPYG